MSTRLTRLLHLFAVVMFLYSCQSPAPIPDPGVSYELNQQRKQNIHDVVYQLSLDIPKHKEERIQGIIQIDFSLKDASLPLVLDFSATDGVVKGLATITKEPIGFTFENGHIIIPSKDQVKGPQSLVIDFTAGDLSLNRNEDFLYTLFVPDRASTCFPLFDQPNIKARYKLQLNVASDWKVCSNGSVKDTTSAGETTLYRFEDTKPISSYLFAFAAGKFKSISQDVDGRSMTMLYRENDSVKVNTNKDEIFRLHGRSLSWLEDYTSIPYPFGKFDFVLIPSFQYGGMEHPGSIFYNESSLFLDENASVNRKMGRASLIAHETAHMWFGDLVTMDWFNDVWMKEVFANFMAAKIVQPSFPDIDHDLRFLLAHYPGAYSVDRTRGANAIIQPLDNLKNAGTMYGPIIYQKAPIVMRHLERMIGKETMQESLREYLAKYQFDNAVWDDLVKIIDDRSPDSIAKWSDVWVKTPGMPEYRWRSIGDTTQLKLEQLATADQRVWVQPVTINPLGADEKDDVFFSDLTTAITDAREGDPLLTNVDGFSYGYFHLPSATEKFFVSHYRNNRKPVFRAAMIMNLWESMLHGDSPGPVKMLDYFNAFLQQEENPLIIDYILGQYETLWWTFLTDDVRHASQKETEQLLWELVQKTRDKGIKASYFRTYRNIAMSTEALETLEGLWNEKRVVQDLSLSEDDKIALAYELAVKIPERQAEILANQIDRTKNPDRKSRLMFVAPALSNDAKVRDQFFLSLQQEVNREHESWVLEALSYIHHPLRHETSKGYLLPSLELLEEIQLTGDIFFPQRWLNTTFEGHSDRGTVEVVDLFLKTHPDYPEYLKKKILQASDMSERAAALKEQSVE